MSLQQPAFIMVNDTKTESSKLSDNESVIAVAYTSAGRVMFGRDGAFVGVPTIDERLAVFHVGVVAEPGKRAVMPVLGGATATKVHRLSGGNGLRKQPFSAYSSLTYADVTSGVDLAFVTTGSGLALQVNLEPGAALDQLRLSAGKARLRHEGAALLAEMGAAQFQFGVPDAYQTVAGRQVKVAVRYRLLQDGTFGFEADDYDKRRALVIRPTLAWSSFLGGSGVSPESEAINAVVVDSAGRPVVAGESASFDFPTTSGVFSRIPSGERDIFVGRLAVDGAAFEFLTLFGSDEIDEVSEMIIDDLDQITLTGQTRGVGFPLSAGAYDTLNEGDDAFVMRLSANGDRIIYSTLIGGDQTDDGHALYPEADGSVWVAMRTRSEGLFVSPGAPATSLTGSSDIYLTRLSADGSELLYGTYFGGSDSDSIRLLDRLEDGRFVLVGETFSSDFPTTSGAFSETWSGSNDIFVALLSADLTTFGPVTLCGGSNTDAAVGFGLDSGGNFLVGGYTFSSDFPSVPGSGYDTDFNGDVDGVILKFSPDLTSLTAASFLGTNEREFIRAMTVDANGRLVVLGTTASGDFPTTAGAYSQTLAGSTDVFVSKFSEDFENLLFSTFIGGSGPESVRDVVLDGDGNFIVVGASNSSDFPAAIRDGGGQVDALVFKLAADGSDLAYAYLVGGGGLDRGQDAAATADGALVLVGSAESRDFPLTSGVFDDTANQQDAFVSVFEPDGATLRFSTLLGGSSNDQAEAVTVAADGRIVVGGSTDSDDFPTTAGAFDQTFDGQSALFVAALSADGSALSFSTLLDGGTSAAIKDMVVAPDGGVILAGSTGGADFPTTTGAFAETAGGGFDGFVSKFSGDGTALQFSTYFGGVDNDRIFGLDVDALNRPVVVGTARDGLPITAGALDETHNGLEDGFVAKLSAAGDALVFSTYMGGGQGDDLFGVMVLDNDEVAVCGQAGSNFPTSPGAYLEARVGSDDAVVAVLSADGSSLVYGTYLGGGGNDGAFGVGLDSTGNLVVGGQTTSEDFPTTAGALNRGRGGEDDNFVAVLGCDGAELRYGSYWGRSGDEELEAFVALGNGRFALFGETGSAAFVTTDGAYDRELAAETDMYATVFDLRPESLSYLARRTYVQGVAPLQVAVSFADCEDAALSVQWFNETDDVTYPSGSNPVSLAGVLGRSVTMRATVTNAGSMNSVDHRIPVLVAADPSFYDYNQDNCSDLNDLRALLPMWRTLADPDPNGDGSVDVRDFLFINTEGVGTCP